MTRKTMMTLFMGLTATTLAATQVEAQSRNCGPRDAVVTHLAEKYSEARVMMGLASNNMVLEVYASGETGTWTVVVNRPGGAACIVASGQHYQATDDAVMNTDPET